MRKFWLAGLFAGLMCGVSYGEIVEMTDGTTKKGTVIRKTETELHLQVDHGGLKATVTLPMKNVARILPSPPEEEAVATPEAASAPVVAQPKVLVVPALPKTNGFLLELAASAFGAGPDDLRRLQPVLQDLWQDAVKVAGKEGVGGMGGGEKMEREQWVKLLDRLRDLNDAFEPLEGGMDRLEAICKRERNESFGLWIAKVRWEVISENYGVGRFDLEDVREVERMPLIGILREKTKTALDPIRGYFPPTHPRTGKIEPFKPAQLAGITVSNAIEVKKRAAYAAAVLLAQLKLEPEMSGLDKAFVGSQLTMVRRVLERATALEPAAKAAERRR
ncbi:MAG: hypothetical protein FWD53_05365 [Phycisphaerales bacterium]|nr:hypothetical protein [Phycisphaerales bacterium]